VVNGVNYAFYLVEDVFLDGHPAVRHHLLHLLFTIIEVLVQVIDDLLDQKHNVLHRQGNRFGGLLDVVKFVAVALQ
jgi:hypothetical protein